MKATLVVALVLHSTWISDAFYTCPVQYCIGLQSLKSNYHQFDSPNIAKKLVGYSSKSSPKITINSLNMKYAQILPKFSRQLHSRQIRIFSSSDNLQSISSEASSLAAQLRESIKTWEMENEDIRLVAAEDSTFGSDKLPKDLMNTIEDSSEELRLEAYTQLLAQCASPKNMMNLAEAKTLRKAASVLCPLKYADRGHLPVGLVSLSDDKDGGQVENELDALVGTVDSSVDSKQSVPAKEITKANISAIRHVIAKLPTKFSEEEHMDLGGWILFLLEFIGNRPLNVDYLATDDQAIGMFFYLLNDDKKREVKAKRKERLFSDSIKKLFPTTKLAFNLNTVAWGEKLHEIANGIQTAYADITPTREDAIFWLRIRGRSSAGDMIRRSAALLDWENGLSEGKSVAQEAMKSSELLSAALDLSALCLQNIILLDNGVRCANAAMYASYIDEHFAGAASEFSKSTPVLASFLNKFIQSALDGSYKLDTIKKFDAILLRRMISMSGSMSQRLTIRLYGKQLGQALLEDPRAPGGPSNRAVVQCLDALDEALEIPFEAKQRAREAALEVYMQKYLNSNAEGYSAEESGSWVCEFLGIPQKRLAEVVESERSKAFVQTLRPILKPNESWRLEQLSDEELESVCSAYERAGLTKKGAYALAVEELRPLLLSLVASASDNMRRQRIEEGSAIIEQITYVVDGLGTQLLMALGGETSTENEEQLCLKGYLTEVQEYWVSELCWALIDRDQEGGGDLPNRVLDLIGIK